MVAEWMGPPSLWSGMFSLPSSMLLLLVLLASHPINTISLNVQENQQSYTRIRRGNQEMRFLDHEQAETVDDNGSCPPCEKCVCHDNNNNGFADEPEMTLQILVVDSPGIITMVKWNADDYFKFTNGRIKIEIKLAPTMPALFEEIESSARSGGGLYDAYYTNPVILGSAAMLGGFMDLTDQVKQSPYADWTDVLLALRTYVTSFEEKIYIILLDGDTHTLFYRRDVLEHFRLEPPRTWNEYNDIAKRVHGHEFYDKTTNTTTKLSGSCISRIQGDHAMYFYHLVLSTITQTQGTDSGSLFDTKDMEPLTGEAMMEMLRIHEEQAKYGTPDEFEDIINHVQNGHMNDGSCVMTAMWGDMFRRSKSKGSILHDKLGVAPTPGSEFVLNRETGKLEWCTKQLCPYAKFYEDLGWVNVAPYAANGGWGASISAHTTPDRQKALADFFLWASSKEQSQQYVIANATLPWYEINGQDPWRKSQLDVDKWVAQGYDRELSQQYVESISSNLVSKNVVVEARFPKAGEIMGVLDKEVNEYLVLAHEGAIAEEDKPKERRKTAQRITDQWNQIIRAYNARGDTVAPILEIYQRLRGVYVPNEDRNYLVDIRPLGFTMMALVWAFAIGSIVWVYIKKETHVVKASQPPFLGMISIGTIILSSSIIPMGIDESVATQKGCTVACQVTPWLIAVGFSTTFAALASKLRRLRILMKNAAQFRRIQVGVKDVMVPFAVILSLNTVFLLIWTIVDPLEWERVSQGRTEANEISSYGRCNSQSKVSSWMIGLLAATNMCAVLYANILAYQTRAMPVAFHESKYIGLSMASIMQASLVGLPLLFLADSNPTAFYVVRSLLVVVITLSVLGFMFVPKMLAHKFMPKTTRSSSTVHVSFNNASMEGMRNSDYKRSSNITDSYLAGSSAGFRINDGSSRDFRVSAINRPSEGNGSTAVLANTGAAATSSTAVDSGRSEASQVLAEVEEEELGEQAAEPQAKEPATSAAIASAAEEPSEDDKPPPVQDPEPADGNLQVDTVEAEEILGNQHETVTFMGHDADDTGIPSTDVIET